MTSAAVGRSRKRGIGMGDAINPACLFCCAAIAHLSGLALCAEETVKRDLTVIPVECKAKSSRPQDWTRRTNPLFSIEADGVDDIHLAYEGEPAPFIVLSNKTSSTLALSGRISVETFAGESFCIDASGSLNASSTRRFGIGRRLRKGPWHVVAALETADSKAVAETRFAVVRRRNVTPPLPPGAFRAGFAYHMARYSDANNEKCLKALIQAGAKIVRGPIGALMNEAEKAEGVYDWSAPDRYLEKLEKAGLALDTNIYWAPYWARDERHGKTPYGKAPMRPGLFREYCKRLSARYGTRIAWYEIGNEWDLSGPERMTTDEAIEMQREGYEGVKAGNPDAKVIPNGWAVVHSDVIPHRTQRNMQERMMTEARSFCDAHTVHQHGSYREYRRRLVEFFAWRKARGIDDLPWYSNETALSVARAGEERVAECVWQKILHAWMHGSVDYIWYNLRAIGPENYGGEQGYGAMTADFYPRMTLSSFAGLTSCFENLRPQRIVHEGPTRDVYLFSGVRSGKNVLVFVGWDLKAKTNVAVRIRTDARRAYAVDLFDNRNELHVADGVVALSIGKTPAAVLLEDVSTAIADAADVCRGEGDEIQDVALGSGGYVFRLQDFDCVFEMYKADPQNFDRVWKGDNDLSATVAINVVGDEFHVDATTRDERPGDGDCLVVIADGVETRFLPAELTKGGARYFGRIPRPGRDAVLEIRIEDDDGRGKEGWVTTGRFRARGADPIGGVRAVE